MKMDKSRIKYSTYEQRVDWLVLHADLWIKWWEGHNTGLEHYIGHKNFWSFLISKMKKDKLVSLTTYPLDIKLKDEMYCAAKIIRSHRKLLNA